MHRKRVTCELHDNYFRLMTIKHAIPKIEWVIELLYNPVTQEFRSWRSDELEKRCGRESHHPAEAALVALSSFEEPLVTSCGRESQHSPESWAPGPSVEHQENEKDTTLMAMGVMVNILQSLFVLQLLLTVKPWVTLFETLTIKWEVHIFLKKSSLVFIHCVSMYSAYMCL